MDKCSQCGVCCKLFLITLTEEEYKSKRYKMQFDEFVDDAEESEILGTHEMGFEEAELCAANIIEQKKDGSCFYLKDKKCSIHDKRPQACRKFFCNSDKKEFQSMIEKIKKEKELNGEKAVQDL